MASGKRFDFGWRAWLPPTRACARDTLILAFSHEGRRDPPAALGAWFRGAGLADADAG